MTPPVRLCVVVGAHLPWVPAPAKGEGEDVRGLYRAVVDGLLPWVTTLEGWAATGVSPRPSTLAPSPTLLALLADAGVRAALLGRARRMEALATLEAGRLEGRPEGEAARWHEARLRATVERLADPEAGDLVAALHRLADRGWLELVAPTAVAAIEGLVPDPSWDRALQAIAVGDFVGRFGGSASDYALAPGPGRGGDLGQAPLDPALLDPTADIGWELPLAYLRPFLGSGLRRSATGLAYRSRSRVEEGSPPPWSPVEARAAVARRAADFVAGLAASGEAVIVSVDLVRGCWIELPWFLEELHRVTGMADAKARTVTVAELEAEGALPPARGAADDPLGPYLTPPCDGVHRHLAEVRARMRDVVIPAATGPWARVARQAAREAVLAHAGDWLDRMRAPEGPGEPWARFEGHVRNFLRLSEGLASGEVDAEFLDELEGLNPVFPSLDVASAFSS